jgi:hypothetical protein
MASGTISLGTSGAILGQIIWSSSSNGTAQNSSQVTASIQVKKTSNTTASTTGTWTGNLNINGDNRTFSIRKEVSKNSWVTLSSFTITKSHNSDGTGTCYIQGRIQGPAGTSQANSVVQGSQTVTLDTIPRQASITNASNFTDIQNPTIQYSNPAGNSVSSLQACISLNGNTDNIKYRDIPKTGTSYTFNLTEAERNVLRQSTPNSNTLNVLFYVRTIINGTTFYSNIQKQMTITNANPTFNSSYKDTNSNTVTISGNNQQIIQNNSTLQINISNITALKYAIVKTISVNVNGNITSQNLTSKQTTATFNIGTINVSSNLTIPITLTDSRGNKTTNNLQVQVLAWSLPTAIINLARVSNYYTEANMTVNAEYSSLNNNNTITIQYQIKKVSDSTYGDLITIQDDVQTTFNADNQYSWNVKVILTDKIGTATYNLLLYKGIPLMYWDRLLSSVSINCFPQNQYSFEVNGINFLDAFYKSGDTFTYYAKSVVTSASSTVFRFQIPLNKVIPSGVTPTVQILSGTLYQSSNSYTLNANNITTSTSIVGSVLEVTCTSSSSLSYTTNVAITGDIRVTVSFS